MDEALDDTTKRVSELAVESNSAEPPTAKDAAPQSNKKKPRPSQQSEF